MTHRRYRIRSESIWHKARDAYLAGEPAASVCDRFGLGLSAFRKRAKANGWRISDQVEPRPRPWRTLEDLPDLPPLALADLVYDQMHLAVRNGVPTHVRNWLNIYERLTENITTSDSFYHFHREFMSRRPKPTSGNRLIPHDPP